MVSVKGVSIVMKETVKRMRHLCGRGVGEGERGLGEGEGRG